MKCDRCEVIYCFEEGDFNYRYGLWREIFKGIPFPKEVRENDFCRKCAVEITPVIRQLRDVVELRRYVNRLKRIIDEETKKRY